MCFCGRLPIRVWSLDLYFGSSLFKYSYGYILGWNLLCGDFLVLLETSLEFHGYVKNLIRDFMVEGKPN